MKILNTKIILYIFIIMVNLSILSSCSLMENGYYSEAQVAIHELYDANNSNTSLDSIKLDLDSYGKFARIVELEKEYLKKRNELESKVDTMEDEMKDLLPKSEKEEYMKIFEDYKKVVEDSYKAEIKTDEKLVEDIKGLKIDSTFVDEYISSTNDRIKFEKEYRDKLYNINVEIIEKRLEQGEYIFSGGQDEDVEKRSELDEEINGLYLKYDRIVEEFNDKVNDRMDRKK